VVLMRDSIDLDTRHLNSNPQAPKRAPSEIVTCYKCEVFAQQVKLSDIDGMVAPCSGDAVSVTDRAQPRMPVSGGPWGPPAALK